MSKATKPSNKAVKGTKIVVGSSSAHRSGTAGTPQTKGKGTKVK